MSAVFKTTLTNSGFFISYKSGSIDEELTEAGNAISILGGQTDRTEKFSIPGTDYERSLVFIKKIKATDKRYPRKAGTPQRKPL
jgi:16S rRNA (guanine527-N7)-methyltransferase